MKIPVPPLAEQKRFVKAVEALEAEITAAESIVAAAPAKKEAILKKYFQLLDAHAAPCPTPAQKPGLTGCHERRLTPRLKISLVT
ncbi:MAG: hypothetical protein ABSF95_23480 [Verrucomicrobiota bacterium]|jgi:hypothetical protein